MFVIGLIIADSRTSNAIVGIQLRESLRKWQSPPDSSTNHNIASDYQHEGSAEWFIKDDKFKEWLVTGSLLWIYGKRAPLFTCDGFGDLMVNTFPSGVWKERPMVRSTYILLFFGNLWMNSSAIINDITTLCDAGSASMAYFYFDFRDLDKKARRNLLPSLLMQLSSRFDPFCDVFSRLHKVHDNGERQPNESALMQCLKEMLTLPSQRPVYLIMDALDECPNTSGFPSARKQVLDLVKDLVGLQLPNLHICVTSRPEVDISETLESLASHAVSLQDENGQKKDIADYIRSVVHSGSSTFMRRWRQEDKEHVIKELSENADGM